MDEKLKEKQDELHVLLNYKVSKLVGFLIRVVLCFFCVRLCLFCMVIHFIHPSHNAKWPLTLKDFHPTFYPILHLNYWERASIFIVMLSEGTAGIIFVMSLVWHVPWLGIEHGASCTRSQHSTTRLSRRRFK